MSEANREILSAGMDGELSREEIRFLLRRLETDAGLAETWARYHVGRDGLRRDIALVSSSDFAMRVMAAIDAEPVAHVSSPRRRWLHWSAGGAIAASVAVAALMLSQPAGSPANRGDVAQRDVTSGESVAETVRTAPAVPQWLSGNMASQFTQKAAFEGSEDGSATYLPRSTPYQIHRTRVADAVDNGGGYMLLTRPDGSRYVQPVALPQAR